MYLDPQKAICIVVLKGLKFIEEIQKSNEKNKSPVSYRSQKLNGI